MSLWTVARQAPLSLGFSRLEESWKSEAARLHSAKGLCYSLFGIYQEAPAKGLWEGAPPLSPSLALPGGLRSCASLSVMALGKNTLYSMIQVTHMRVGSQGVRGFQRASVVEKRDCQLQPLAGPRPSMPVSSECSLCPPFAQQGPC